MCYSVKTQSFSPTKHTLIDTIALATKVYASPDAVRINQIIQQV